MMFSAGLLITAGITIATAAVDKVLENSGFHWLGTILRVAVPLTAMVLGVHFLQSNEILRWLR
jgi:hypothetical protein